MKTRSKGYRSENQLVHLLNRMGLTTKRRYMSGQASHTGDLDVEIKGDTYMVEVKAFSKNFQEYGWLEHSDIVFKRTVRKGKTGEWLVVMPFKVFKEVVLTKHYRRKE